MSGSTNGATPATMGYPKLLVLLLLGGVCVAFGQGRWPVALGAWLAPVLLIGFSRAAPVWLGVLGFTVVHAAGWEVAYLGMVKMPLLLRWTLFLGLSLAMSFVYQADRWAAKRSSGFWTTLTLPCGWVAFEYLNGRFSPSGSRASIAYTFTDQLGLAQIASIVGWTGLTFLVGWVASTVHWARERSASGQSWRTGVMATGTAIAFVLVFGGVRLWRMPDGPTVRVAALVGPSSYWAGGAFSESVWACTRGVELPEEEIALARRDIERTIDRYLTLAERALGEGAQIVSFPEANPSITKREESIFVDGAARLADEYDAYVGLGLFVFRPEEGSPAENKYVLLGPEGTVVWDYLKARLVPGSGHVTGDGVLPDVETSFARISCAICFDMDFPVLLQQAGRSRTDILLAPSNDWTEVRTTHARMAVMRAIEQGFAMVRPTKDGLALVTDAYGRTIARQDTDRSGVYEHALIADAPVSGVVTVYSLIGDTFSWACLAGFGVLVGLTAIEHMNPARSARA